MNEYIKAKLKDAAEAALHDTQLNQDANSYAYHVGRLVEDFVTTIEVYIDENASFDESEPNGQPTDE